MLKWHWSALLHNNKSQHYYYILNISIGGVWYQNGKKKILNCNIFLTSHLDVSGIQPLKISTYHSEMTSFESTKSCCATISNGYLKEFLSSLTFCLCLGHAVSCYAFRRSESRCPLALQWGQKLQGSPRYFQMAKLHRGATMILDYSPIFLLSKGNCWWKENILKCNIIWNICTTSYLYFSMKHWSNNRQLFIKITNSNRQLSLDLGNYQYLLHFSPSPSCSPGARYWCILRTWSETIRSCSGSICNGQTFYSGNITNSISNRTM